VEFAAATQPRGRIPRYLAPAVLAILLGAVIVVVLTTAGSSGTRSSAANVPRAAVRSLPSYWNVRPGDTYEQISEKTGLSVDQLEAFNPHTDPRSLAPGQRLKLSLHPPAPRPKPPGPRSWTVRSGESFGSIAAKTGINLTKLEQLNPKLKPTTLQPGDRMRLRP
jgi:N-acetylmuramoyl-L-alanine amidase